MAQGSNPAAPATRNVAESNENQTDTGTSAQGDVSKVSQPDPVTRAKRVRAPKGLKVDPVVGQPALVRFEGGEWLPGQVAEVFPRTKHCAVEVKAKFGQRFLFGYRERDLRLLPLGDDGGGVRDERAIVEEAAELGDAHAGGLAGGELEHGHAGSNSDLQTTAGAREGGGGGLGDGSDALAGGGGLGEREGGAGGGECAGGGLHAENTADQPGQGFGAVRGAGEGDDEGSVDVHGANPGAFEAGAGVGGGAGSGVEGLGVDVGTAGEQGEGGKSEGEVSHAATIGSPTREPESGVIPSAAMPTVDTERAPWSAQMRCEVHGDYLPCDGCAREDGGGISDDEAQGRAANGSGEAIPRGCDCNAEGYICPACIEHTQKCARFGCARRRTTDSIWCAEHGDSATRLFEMGSKLVDGKCARKGCTRERVKGHAFCTGHAGCAASVSCANLPAMPPDEAAVRASVNDCANCRTGAPCERCGTPFPPGCNCCDGRSCPEEAEQPNDHDPEDADKRWASRLVRNVFEAAWQHAAEDSENDPRTVARCKALFDYCVRAMGVAVEMGQW